MESRHYRVPAPDANALRHFGFVTGAALILLFGVLVPMLRGTAPAVWPWAAGAVLLLCALLRPLWLRPFHHAWMRFGQVMNRLTTPLLLGGVYFLAICPIGMLRRLLGRDDLGLRFDRGAQSYRVPSAPRDPESMEKPF
jgi:Saxitoxin biosynthesis operon protein SxtJ